MGGYGRSRKKSRRRGWSTRGVPTPTRTACICATFTSMCCQLVPRCSAHVKACLHYHIFCIPMRSVALFATALADRILVVRSLCTCCHADILSQLSGIKRLCEKFYHHAVTLSIENTTVYRRAEINPNTVVNCGSRQRASPALGIRSATHGAPACAAGSSLTKMSGVKPVP